MHLCLVFYAFITNLSQNFPYHLSLGCTHLFLNPVSCDFFGLNPCSVLFKEPPKKETEGIFLCVSKSFINPHT